MANGGSSVQSVRHSGDYHINSNDVRFKKPEKEHINASGGAVMAMNSIFTHPKANC